MTIMRLYLAILLTSFVPAVAQGQVIEIDSSGEARTYDGPTLFVDSEPTPIGPSRALVTTGGPKRCAALPRWTTSLGPAR